MSRRAIESQRLSARLRDEIATVKGHCAKMLQCVSRLEELVRALDVQPLAASAITQTEQASELRRELAGPSDDGASNPH